MGPGLREYAADPEEYQIFTPMDFAHDNCQYRGTGHVYRYAMEYLVRHRKIQGAARPCPRVFEKDIPSFLLDRIIIIIIVLKVFLIQ